MVESKIDSEILEWLSSRFVLRKERKEITRLVGVDDKLVKK